MLDYPFDDIDRMLRSFQEQDTMGKINVRGEGVATAEPDVADVSFRVESTGARPSESISKNATAMKALLDVAAKYGIEKKDTRTTDFGNDAVFEQQEKPKANKKPKPPKLLHYLAYNQIEVRLKDVDKLGEFLTDLAAAGAMSLSTQFDIGDKSALQEQAREKAFNDAKAKATQYAKLAGVELGKLTDLSESHSWGNPRAGSARMAKACVTQSVMLESVPMEGGEQEVTVNVNAAFEIP